jgi:D-alanine-D-alanine ligase
MIKVNPDWWKSLFDEIYLLTDARSVCNEEVTQREVEAVCSLLPLSREHTILDLCGGQGRHSLELARRGYSHCRVLDYSQVLIDVGRAKAQAEGLEVQFVQANAVATGLAKEHYDSVLILGNSLGYLPDTSDDLRIMQEVLRLLKPGGQLLVDVTDGTTVRERFNANAWHEIDEQVVVCRQRALTGETVHAREMVLCKDKGLVRDQTYAIRLFTSDDLKTLVLQAGFINCRIRTGYSSQDKEGDYGFMNHRLLLAAQKPA